MITAARKALEEDLSTIDDLHVYTTLPASIATPAALIIEDTPFLESKTFNTINANFQVILLVGDRPADREGQLAELDQLTSTVFALLDNTAPTSVENYQTFTFANQQPLMGSTLKTQVLIET